jgi:hypothetical protein
MIPFFFSRLILLVTLSGIPQRPTRQFLKVTEIQITFVFLRTFLLKGTLDDTLDKQGPASAFTCSSRHFSRLGGNQGGY